jgi:DNA-binding Lrp family transcriptional regulator
MGSNRPTKIELDDVECQILRVLYELGPSKTSEIVDAINGNRQQVHYRVKNRLIGKKKLVMKVSELGQPGGANAAAIWRLTEAGEEYIKHYPQQIKKPINEEESQQLAAEARQKAKSAESAAASANGKIGEMEAQVDQSLEQTRQLRNELESRVEEIEASLQTVDEQMRRNTKALRNHKQAPDQKQMLDIVDRKLNGYATEGRLSNAHDRCSDLEERVRELEHQSKMMVEYSGTITERWERLEGSIIARVKWLLTGSYS